MGARLIFIEPLKSAQTAGLCNQQPGWQRLWTRLLMAPAKGMRQNAPACAYDAKSKDISQDGATLAPAALATPVASMCHRSYFQWH